MGYDRISAHKNYKGILYLKTYHIFFTIVFVCRPPSLFKNENGEQFQTHCKNALKIFYYFVSFNT